MFGIQNFIFFFFNFFLMSSVFDFINNDTADENGGNEGFSFADAEKNDSQEIEFSFGEDENEQKTQKSEEKAEERKREKQPLQKKSRAIGTIPPKKVEKRTAKFAKKKRSSTPIPSPEKTTGNQPTQQTQQNTKTGSVLTRTRSSEILFNLSETPKNSPTKPEESAETGKTGETEANLIESSTNENQETEKNEEIAEESAFDFISGEKTEQKEEEQKEVEENAGKPEKQLVQTQKREIPKYEKKFERENYQKFADEMFSISYNVQQILNENKSMESSIQDTEKDLQEYTEKEDYEKADEISTKLNNMKTKIFQQTKEQANYIQKALTISKELPDMFTTHSKEAQQNYERFVNENEQLHNKLSFETTTKQKNEATIQKEREKNKLKISQLEMPIKTHENKINALQLTYDTNVKNVSQPFDDEIAKLTNEKTEVNNRIAQLLKEVEDLRARDKQIDQTIASQKKQKQQEINKFGNDKIKISNERAQLAKEKQKFDEEVRKIEAPYQRLIDDVNRRTKVISDLEEKIRTTEEAITTNKKAADEEEDTLRIIHSLLEDYSAYSTERQSLSADLDKYRDMLSKTTARMKELNSEMITYRSNLDTSEEMIAGAKAKEDQLEAEKKKFVSAKNFRMAKQITEQLNDFRDLAERADKTIADCALGISNGQEEMEKLKADSSNAEENIKELTDKLNKLDFEFFDETSISLEALFKVSDFASSILESFQQMIATLLSLSPHPPQLTKEEIQAQIDALNAKIEEAVAIEDYDTCETLQEKVDILTAKLEKLE